MSSTRRISALVITLSALLNGAAAQAAGLTIPLAEAAVISEPGNPTNVRVLLRFDVPLSLSGSTVDLAMLHIALPLAEADVDEVPFEVFPVTREWSAGEVAWDEGWADGDGTWSRADGALIDIPVGEERSVRIDVTRLVQTWVDGGLANHGSVLVPSKAPAVVASLELAAAPTIYLRYSPKRQAGARR